MYIINPCTFKKNESFGRHIQSKSAWTISVFLVIFVLNWTGIIVVVLQRTKINTRAKDTHSPSQFHLDKSVANMHTLFLELSTVLS